MLSTRDYVISEKVERDVSDVLENGWLAPLSITNKLEQELCRITGLPYGLTVNSLKSGLLLAAITSGIGKDTKTIVFPSVEKECAPIARFLGENVHVCDSIPNDAKVVMIGNEDVIMNIPSNDVCVIQVMGQNALKANGFANVSIVEFENLLSVMTFKSNDQMNRCLQMRDWGRAGSQDENLDKRYSSFNLEGVRYDWKFVFCDLGFNFKSCEMAAAIALDILNEKVNP